MEIFKTKDYDSFRVITSNREVNKAHVKKLAQSIKRRNLLFLRPVICTPSMEVIDGQHRIAACQILGEEVFYIKAKLTKEDIAILNTAQKNWTMMDFINFFAIEGRQDYKELCKLINKYPEVKVTSIMRLCGNSTNVLQGRIDISNLGRAQAVCCWIRQLRNKGYNFVCERDFALAINIAVETESDFDKLLGRANVVQFHKCDSKNEYVKMIKQVIR